MMNNPFTSFQTETFISSCFALYMIGIRTLRTMKKLVNSKKGKQTKHEIVEEKEVGTYQISSQDNNNESLVLKESDHY